MKKDKGIIWIQQTLFMAPDETIIVGSGTAIKYDDWLYDERDRFRSHGRKAEVRRENHQKALFVNKVA